MEWIDDGIVLGVRRHGEANAILELMTRGRGRHLGLVRGGAGSRLRPILQPGNSVRATWRARLDEHLGTYTVEGLRLRAGEFLTDAHAVYAITHVAALCRLLPERDPHEAVHDMVEAILERIADRTLTAALIAHFELRLIGELGFSLDLDRCGATGEMDELIYVSPRSGRAISRIAGAPWRDRLLRLPSFLKGMDVNTLQPSAEDIADAFTLTGYFLSRHVLEPRGLAFSDARHAFVAAITNP